jgi:hypothetical protein
MLGAVDDIEHSGNRFTHDVPAKDGRFRICEPISPGSLVCILKYIPKCPILEEENALSGASSSGSGTRIRAEDLQVMRSNPKIGALDSQAVVPREAY